MSKNTLPSGPPVPRRAKALSQVARLGEGDEAIHQRTKVLRRVAHVEAGHVAGEVVACGLRGDG
ncbi:MAG: hypothetical protein JRG93_02630 [Deltaproteobacteria bacterium]|nr:hypothetical protein [Deltaproteobacteria bacterium]